MAAVRLDLKEAQSMRFKRLADACKLSPPTLLGVLAMFWGETRAAGLEQGDPDTLSLFVHVPARASRTVLGHMKTAGYLAEGPTPGLLSILDNAGYNAKAERIRARNAKAGSTKGKKRPRAAAAAATDKPRPPAKAASGPSGLSPFRAQCQEAWVAYAQAYEARLKVLPPRNAKANALIQQLVHRLPAEEVPAILRFYVGHTSPFYMERVYPLELAVRDAEALRTQWLRGQQVTRDNVRYAAQSETYHQMRARLAGED